MSHFTHDIPYRLITVLTKAFSTFLLVSVFCILQYMFDMEFDCFCIKGVHRYGVWYILLPPVILAWFVNITEPIHRKRIFSSCCPRARKSILCRLGSFILDYFGLFVVWFSTVLFDGDWYVCLQTSLNDTQTRIPCKKNLTYEESQIKAYYKTESLDYGLIAITFLLLLLWVIGDFISDGCSRSETCCRSKLKRLPHYRVVYENLLEEQVNSYLNDKLLKIAKKRASAICASICKTIRGHELNNVDRKSALKSWWKISDLDFYLTELETQEMSSRKGATSLKNPSLWWHCWKGCLDSIQKDAGLSPAPESELSRSEDEIEDIEMRPLI